MRIWIGRLGLERGCVCVREGKGRCVKGCRCCFEGAVYTSEFRLHPRVDRFRIFVERCSTRAYVSSTERL